MFDDSPSELRAAALVLDAVTALCTELEPDAVTAPAVGPVFDALVKMRRLVDGAITRLSPRFERSGAWKDRGAKSPEDGIARATGTSPADAKRRMETAHELGRRTQLDHALRNGEVSTEQAKVIAGAAHDVAAESKLIGVAKSSSHAELCREAARELARADHDEHERRRRQRKLRCVRRWADEEGMYNLHLRTLPELGAQIDARLQPEIDRVFAQARGEGRREPVPAYAADAVTDLLRGMAAQASPSSGQAVRPERKVIALVDIDALNRGHAVGGETCEIAGVGPVSVAAVRGLFGDAAMAVVFRDAVDIRSVVHLGRQVTASQRTALEARGPVCSIVGCGSTHQLEIDHTIGWSYTRTTNVDDLDWLCSTDHALKTRHNLLAIGPPGNRILVERDPNDPTKPSEPVIQVRPAPARGDPRGPDPTSPRAGPQASFDFAS